MSKSLGNSPDPPLDLIAKVGADGLRFGIIRIAPQGQDIRYDEQQIVEGRNFFNKFWNACPFRQIQGEIDRRRTHRSTSSRSSPRTCWPSSTRPSGAFDTAYDEYRFSEVAAGPMILSGAIQRPLHRGGQGGFPKPRPPRGHAGHDRLRDRPRAALPAPLRALYHRGAVARAGLRHGEHSVRGMAQGSRLGGRRPRRGGL